MLNLFKGWFGEKETQLAMWARLESQEYIRFHNVILPSKHSTTQLDHIVLSNYGIFVVETKNIDGWIFGNETSQQWTQSLYGKKYRFQNPLHQNYRHTRAVIDHLGVGENHVHSIVFFIGENSQLKTELPKNVMTEGLYRYIKSFKWPVFSEEEVSRFAHALEMLKEGGTSGREHIANLRGRFASSDACPKCGSQLVVREARKGQNAGNQFLGCSGFPKCKYSKGL